MKKRTLLLASLCTLLGINNIQAQSNGEYLLQNVETGYFLGGGQGWGTQASLLGKPQWFNLTQVTGGYTLDSRQYNNASDHFLGAFNGSNQVYVDAAAATWTLTEVGTGVYTLNNNGYLATAGLNQGLTKTDDASSAAKWRLVSTSDFASLLGTATVDGPVDATALIRNPEFKRNSNTSHYPTWTVTGADGTGSPSNITFGGDWQVANCAESYHASNGFRVAQTLSGMPAGTYRLDAKAFYRQDGSDHTNLPYVFLGTEQATFPLRTGSENSMAAAYTSFLAGNYATEPLFAYVDGSGTIEVGVHGPVNAGLWNIWGEFGLTYYGDVSVNEVKLAAYIATYEAALANTRNYRTQPLSEADLATLNAAISANTLDLSSATQQQLIDATAALNAAAQQAAKDVVKQQNAQAAADKLSNDDHDFTEFILNPSFETGDLTGWTAQEWGGTQNNTSFAIKDGTYYAEKWTWSGSASTTLTDGSLMQTINGLPAGTYKLTALAQNLQQGDASVATGGFFLVLNGSRTEVSTAGTYAATVVLNEGESLTLGAQLDGCTGNYACVDHFTLTYMQTLATAEDYNALAAAIAGSKPLGFLPGQYAPYTNSAALEALAAAQAINPGVENERQAVQAATAALNAAAWTENDTELNAIYDGTLIAKEVSTASGQANAQMTAGGWKANSAFRLILGDQAQYPALAQTTDGRGLFSWNSTHIYGEQAAYAMPLEANTEYVLSFLFAGWNGSVNSVKASVLNAANEGLALSNAGSAAKGPQTAGAFKQARFTFTTGAAGNYVLHIEANGNFSLADLSLYTAKSVTLSDDDTALPAIPAGVADVNYTRTLYNGWNSLVLPFATSVSELGADKAYAYTGTTLDADGGYIVELSNVNDLEAHTPYIVYVSADKALTTFRNKTLSATAGKPATADETNDAFTFTGTYAALAAGNTAIRQGDYIVGEQGFKRAKGGNKLKAYRAYLVNEAGGSAGIKGFTIDGSQPTAIEAIGLESALTGESIYNLNGQRVQKAQQGIYIVGGRKVVVK